MKRSGPKIRLLSLQSEGEEEEEEGVDGVPNKAVVSGRLPFTDYNNNRGGRCQLTAEADVCISR